MSIFFDNRVVMTLDAGNSNFVFSAMKGGREVVLPIVLPASTDDLDLCLENIIKGFETVLTSLDCKPDAISFAFPGPSDYERGIIGDLGNFPAFQGGVALGPMLEDRFEVPVYIRNDGDLFTYGEAVGGALSEVNQVLAEQNIDKRYRNLVGITIGIGFGAGVVHNRELLSGDNNLAAEIWNTSNSLSPTNNTETKISYRGIINEYYEHLSDEPKRDIKINEVLRIANDSAHSNHLAAKSAFATFGQHLGNSIANLINLFDSSVVIGSGIHGAESLYMPELMKVLCSSFSDGTPRVKHQISLLTNHEDYAAFTQPKSVEVKVPFSDRMVEYEPSHKVFIAKSKLGCSKAIAIGAYAFALDQLDKKLTIENH
ncbi:MAG: ROK family protein [Alteromonadaceae bacterium]|nr:ROK family protein [Alteromonadaceae bacterium]